MNITEETGKKFIVYLQITSFVNVFKHFIKAKFDLIFKFYVAIFTEKTVRKCSQIKVTHGKKLPCNFV